ncbi:MAG: Transcriptional regulatory protein KdpE [Glaciihabitans sp.]|nr:Transcriptional regulatory protein KdpE [Glaciihabitans sp.]
MKILVADDDPQILRALKVTLGARGYEILTAVDGADALNQAINHHPDLVMLDLGMPRLNGIEVIEGLRGWSQVPILVVSGRTGASEKVAALDAGADDYVTKPFAMNELLARIRALSRRLTVSADGPVTVFGPITVDISAKQVTRAKSTGREVVSLTPTEWRILELMVQNPGKLITRESMLIQVWGAGHTRDTGYLRLYLAQLRKKLEPEPSSPRYFLTVPGMGYRFEPDEVAES